MPTLQYVLTEKSKQLKLYALQLFTPPMALQWCRSGGRVYLVVVDGAQWYTVDLRTLALSSDQLSGYANWTSCLAAWTTAGIWPVAYDAEELAQHVPIPKFAQGQTAAPTATSAGAEFVDALPWYKTPTVHGCDASTMVQVGYGAPSLTYPRTRPFWGFHRDVLFSSKVGEALTLNFDNCLPICGGSAYLPEVIDDVLYARDAAFTILPTYQRNRNYFLLDFTPVGGLSVLQFSSCALSVVGNWLQVIVPGSTNMVDRSVVLSLYGKLHLLGQYAHRVNDDTLMISLDLLRSSGLCLDQLRSSSRTTNRTMAVTAAQDDTTLIADLTTKTHSFIAVVNTAKLFEHQLDETDHIGTRVHRFPRGARGILRNNITGHIQDYVLLDYYSDVAVITQEERPLLMPKGQLTDHSMKRTAFLHNRNGVDRFFNDYHNQATWSLFEWLTTQELIDHAS